jgi:BlaI family transcriptional regulator, penicillinase repressor
MARSGRAEFSRREREIMDALYALGEGGAAEVADHIGDPDGYDSIRVTLGILERKGHLQHRQEGLRNIYRPVVSRDRARRKAMQHLVKTFFAGSSSRAILAFLDQSGHRMSDEELDAIAEWIEQEGEGK